MTDVVPMTNVSHTCKHGLQYSLAISWSDRYSRITDIREDRAKLTTYLAAQPASWSEVAGTYDLDFGKAAMAPPRHRRRGLFDFFSDVGDFILHGDVDFDKSANFPVAIGTPGEKHSILDTAKSVACTSSFSFVVHVD